MSKVKSTAFTREINGWTVNDLILRTYFTTLLITTLQSLKLNSEKDMALMDSTEKNRTNLRRKDNGEYSTTVTQYSPPFARWNLCTLHNTIQKSGYTLRYFLITYYLLDLELPKLANYHYLLYSFLSFYLWTLGMH